MTKVYIFSGDITWPRGMDLTTTDTDTDQWSQYVLTRREPESLFGSQVSWSHDNSDGSVVMAVAAERSSLGSRLGGSIYIYSF